MSQPGSRKERFSRFKLRTLVEEIKDIINKYPDDGQIFKELIQNAEDAGATEIVFIYDQNDYTSIGKRYSVDGIKTLQGPCLYAYNNGYFDDNDWDGIRSLAISNKRTDPLKVGRFGLGFKSVFHLTDVPCIASGSSMAYLNPLKDIFDKEMEFLEFEEEKADAAKFYNFSDFNCYKRVPEEFSINSNGYCNGTVFRFPLRRRESEISTSIYTHKRMENLIATFIAEGTMNLLFLKNIKSIKFFIIKENGTHEELYQVCLEKDCNRNYGKPRQQFIKNVREQTEKKSFTPQNLNHCVDLIERKNGKESKHSFVLSEVYGYSGSDHFRKLIEDPELSYVPLVGIAFPLNGNSGGHVYCGLPLPLTEKSMTGLPVHVNGYFSLSDDRRDLKWKTISSKVSNDKSAVWNEYLIKKLFPSAYCNLMKYLIQLNKDHNVFYSAWPNQDIVNEKWRMFINRLYEQMLSFNCVFITSKGTWNNVQNTFFLKVNEFESNNIYLAVKRFLERTPYYTACVPSHVLKSLPHATTVTNEFVLNVMRTYPNCYKELGRKEQIDLLSYAVKTASDVNRLTGLDVLPLVNGNYGMIKQSQQNLIYIPTKDHPADVLPTQDDVLNLSLLSRAPCLLEVLQQASSNGNTNLCCLDDWRKVVKVIKDKMPANYWPANYTGMIINQFENYWLERFWNYKRQQNIPINYLNGMHLIPLIVSGQKYLHEIRTASLLMLTSERNQHISNQMQKFLEKCGLKFADTNALNLQIWYDLSSNQKILFPDSNGIITALDYAAKSSGEDCVSSLCAKESNTLRNEVVVAATNFTSLSFPSVIMKLPLFKVFGGSNFTSIDQSYLVDKRYIPSVWRSDFANIIESESVPHDIVKKVVIARWNFEDIAGFLFTRTFSSLNVTDKDTLYTFILKYISKNEVTNKFLLLLKQYLVVKSGNTRKRPTDLFQCTPEMKVLFYGENGKFPDDCYNHYSQALIKLGLKREQKEISPSNIADRIYAVQNLQSAGIMNDDLRKKVKAILEISNMQHINLSQFSNVAWIPISQEKPYGYPRSLYWAGSDKFALDGPNNVFSKKYVKVVASISKIVHDDVSQLFHNIFGNQSPPVMLVCRHLENIVQSYNEGESLPYKEMIENIYSYLSKCNFNEVVGNLKSTVTKVWYGNHFINFNKILKHKTSISVEPYYYCLTAAVPNSFHKFVMELGNGLQETDIYIDVLQKMFQKYHDNQDVKFSSDLELSLKIIKYLAETFEKIPEEKKSLICVPMASHFIKYSKLKDCFYHNSGGPYFSSAEEHNILHPSIDKDIALKLGIPNLISRVLSDDDYFESWGQEESLVLRLNRLLKDYEDGMAIPKELIQNADDAGATTVSFLFDERENNELKTTLFHPEMKEWQGPALWVFNDGQFSEEDFRNITRLNAGTKNEDLTKIGKFGLGFNAVYHLTDVPSFISGQSMVIFDPHTVYLGDALRDKKPGVRVNFLSSKKDYKHFSHQFKVFDGIFGAKMDFDERNVESFPGTLFRLPLRNSKTANHSDISKLVYNDKEMDELLSKLQASLNYLLLFTQNVKSINCYHLGKNARSVTDMRLKFSVCKETNNSSQRNVVKLADSVLKSNLRCPIPNEKVLENVRVIVNNQNEEERSNWLISSCIGGQSSFEFAKRRSGFNPCGGVAIRYEVNSNGNISLLDEKNRCFMFCFLPLPENSHLPVHVNGAFEVSNDRKRLVQHTSDEKRYGEVSEWNSLLGGDIGEAYYNLLSWLKDKIVDVSLKSWLGVMPSLPLPAENKCIIELCKSLMKKILTRNENLFPCSVSGGVSWTSWKCIILTNKLPTNLQNSAMKFINWFEKLQGSGKVCLDIPGKFIQLIEELGCSEVLASSYISASQFYQIFFRYIDHKSLDETLRNEILKIFIRMHSLEDVRCLLSSVPCIPTEPNGTLKVPSDLVQPNSKVAELYELSDEVFPQKPFESLHFELEKLGMNVHQLPWPMILDRAKSIADAEKSCDDTAVFNERSNFLLHLITDHPNRNCPLEIHDDLIQTSFLPVLQRSDDTIFTWYSNGQHFGAPQEMYHHTFKDVVSCVGLVCRDFYESNLSAFLGLDKIPAFEMIKKHLICVIDSFEMNGKMDDHFIKTLTAIYEHLSKYNMDENFEALAKLKMLFTENGALVEPNKIFMNAEQEISGYLHKLPLILHSHKKLLLQLGVMKTCSIMDYFNILCDIKSDYEDEQLPSHLLKGILHHIIPYLCNNIVDIKEYDGKDMYIPDHHGYMQNLKDLCFRNAMWLPEEEGVLYANDEIAHINCKHLGIKSLGNQFLEKNSFGIPFGQHEELCTRIKNLLKGYANTDDVLKEILQNADDAGATEVEFILDLRHHNSEKVFCDNWKLLQGPALLVCNNGKFTESDLKAIQSLGMGNKSTNPLKTGKYGVGFNAVYHLTDCPSLLTDIDGKEDVLCIFDPNLNYIDGATELKPGRMVENARKKLEDVYTDVKSTYLLDEYDSKNKTLFRFPLRTAEMISSSKLSTTVVSVEDMRKKLETLKKESLKSLLFLKHVNYLTFRIISEDGVSNDKIVFRAKSYDVKSKDLKEFQLFEKNFLEKHGNLANIMRYVKKLNRHVCLQHLEGEKLVKSYHLQVIEQCGFSQMDQLPSEILTMIEKNELNLTPRGAVASPVHDTCCERCEELPRHDTYEGESYFSEKNLVFCTLPILEPSKLPVIINGHFVLNYETRRCLYSNQSNCEERQWNVLILNNCILPCYIDLLLDKARELSGCYEDTEKEEKEKELRRYSKWFPIVRNASDTVDYWQIMKKTFYNIIYTSNHPILPVHNVKEREIAFCKPKDDFLLFELDAEEKDRPPLLKVLQSAHILTDILPKDISNSFAKCHSKLTSVSPTAVRECLRENYKSILPQNNEARNVKDTVFEKVENVVMMLKYCLKKEKEKTSSEENDNIQKTEITENSEENSDTQQLSLQNLPLCLLADETLDVFSSEKKIFFTRYSTLIDGEERLFLHKKAFNSFAYRNYGIDQFDCFQEFTLEEFDKLLPKVLPPEIFKDADGPIPFPYENVDITKDWLKGVWKYIESQRIPEKGLSLESISGWSLLLCKQRDQGSLVPINKSKYVLNLFSGPYRKLSDILFPALRNDFHILEASYIKPERQIRPSNEVFIYEEETSKEIFGAFGDVRDFINAIWYSYKQKLFQDVKVESAREVLRSLQSDFTENIDMSITEKLKELPLYEQYDGKLTCGRNSMVVLPQFALVNGLDDIETCNQFYLVYQTELIPLYKALGFQICDISSFYEVYIFPAFPHFSDDVVIDHMTWIRDHQREFSEVELSGLKSIEFIPCEGRRKQAAELYDPNNKVFKLMLNDSDFPPEKFLDTYWYPFLKQIGLITELDEKMFNRFAEEIEKEVNEEKALQASKYLCELLSPLNGNQAFTSPLFLSYIKRVRFIIPNKMSDVLERIHVSKNADLVRSGLNRIHFENSATRKQNKMCWTTLHILPNYADVMYGLGNELGIKSHLENVKEKRNCVLDADAVLKHLENITGNRLTEKGELGCFDIPEAERETFWEVMEKIYEFLMERVDLQKLEKWCRNVNLILVSNGEKLCVPSKAVLSKEYAIPDYLNVVWVKQGRYFEMFEQIGCAQVPNAKHYQSVLEEIFQQTTNILQNPNELKAVKSATFLLSTVLPQSHEKLTEDLSLHLPTVTFQSKTVSLTLSSDAIYVDDHHREKRLKSFTKRILITKYQENQEDKVNETLAHHLPDHMKPKRLSDVVKEELDGGVADSVLVGSDHVSELIKAKFHSQRFRSAIERLIKHQQKIRQTVDDVPKQLKVVTDALAQVQVFVLAEVKTHLTYEGVIINGSQISNSCYLQFRSNGLSIYFSQDARATAVMYTKIAVGLLEIFKNVITDEDTVLQLPIVLQHHDVELSKILDDAGILNESAETYLDFGKEPSPGELLPMELHGLLSNDMKNFKEGEYVAMEIGENENLQYIFVIIRKVGNEPDLYQREYGVQTTEDITDVFYTKAYNLYKFKRVYSSDEIANDTSLVLRSESGDDDADQREERLFEEEEDNRSFEEITQEIQKILRNCAGDERKKIARRLYLRWHPDKNPDEKKELATKVFQFIQNELEGLNEGYKETFSYWNTTAQRESRSHQSYRRNFREQRRNHYSGSFNGFRNGDFRFDSGSGWNVPPTFDRRNPQPAEAKRWFKQAKFDLAAMEDKRSTEWICFIAHQASQKALKAVRYLQDYERSTTTNLVTLSAGLTTDLCNLARELETLVRSSTHLLNPDSWRRPRIPHTEYTEEMAARAMEIAKQIVKIVENQM